MRVLASVTIRDVDRQIKQITEYQEIITKLIAASQDSDKGQAALCSILGSNSPEFHLNGISNLLIMYKAFLTELRDNMQLSGAIDLKLLSKLL